jgi:hypothetical protein
MAIYLLAIPGRKKAICALGKGEIGSALFE